MNKIGIIYKATSPSGKVYIGQTIITLSRRKIKHYYRAFNKNDAGYNYKISCAIRKYGDSIEWIVLHHNIFINNLNKLEIEEIKKHNSFNSGYNLSLGGKGSIGRIVSKETCEKISKANEGKKHSDKTRKKMSESSARAKLNLKIAQEIRMKYTTGKYSHRQLAKEYGVSHKIIGNVVNHISWNE